MSRARLNIFIETDHARRLEELAALKGLSKSSIIAAALASFLSPDAADRREAAFAKRLDRLSNQFDKLERDQNILIETLALYIRYFLTVSAPVPEAQQEAARAQGRLRFQQFIEQLGRNLMRGRSLVKDIQEEVFPDAGQFFAMDDPAAPATSPPDDGGPRRTEQPRSCPSRRKPLRLSGASACCARRWGRSSRRPWKTPKSSRYCSIQTARSGSTSSAQAGRRSAFR